MSDLSFHALTKPPGDTPQLEPGEVIADRFRIESQLGSGGMGTVYLAHHVHMRRRVAVKLLNRDMCANEEIVARFQREAVAAAHIGHPNVAGALDFGRLPDGSFYLVLEYIEGPSLRKVLGQGALGVERTLRVGRDIAHGLAAAHDKGIVHRDLKPENVILAANDTVKVLDFGLAKLDGTQPGGAPVTAGAPQLTRVGTVFGTPSYMSPEQALGQAVDHRTDLYALGVMLYEMLAEVRPFQDDDQMALLRRHVLDDVPPLPDIVQRQVPPELPALVRRLLAKSASLRPDTATEVASDLERIRRGLDPSTASLPLSPAAPEATAVGMPPPTVADGATEQPPTVAGGVARSPTVVVPVSDAAAPVGAAAPVAFTHAATVVSAPAIAPPPSREPASAASARSAPGTTRPFPILALVGGAAVAVLLLGIGLYAAMHATAFAGRLLTGSDAGSESSDAASARFATGSEEPRPLTAEQARKAEERKREEKKRLEEQKRDEKRRREDKEKKGRE